MGDTAELAIRLRRAEFNRALAERRLDPIGPILAPGVVLVTGTDSGVISGRKAQLLAWKREFAAAGRITYSRLPQSIELSPVEPIALEHGRWHGADSSGAVSSSGSYAAKWRRIEADWVIEAEIFVTLG
jgi:hypothetical protein